MRSSEVPQTGGLYTHFYICHRPGNLGKFGIAIPSTFHCFVLSAFSSMQPLKAHELYIYMVWSGLVWSWPCMEALIEATAVLTMRNSLLLTMFESVVVVVCCYKLKSIRCSSWKAHLPTQAILYGFFEVLNQIRILFCWHRSWFVVKIELYQSHSGLHPKRFLVRWTQISLSIIIIFRWVWVIIWIKEWLVY